MQRTYVSQDACPVARTLDIVGDRWTLLVLRDLGLGYRRFNEILQSCEGISTNLLANRLKKLEERGMVERAFYSDHPPRAEYHLTEKGQAFRKVIRALYDWGSTYDPRPTDRQLREILHRSD